MEIEVGRALFFHHQRGVRQCITETRMNRPPLGRYKVSHVIVKLIDCNAANQPVNASADGKGERKIANESLISQSDSKLALQVRQSLADRAKSEIDLTKSLRVHKGRLRD